MVSRSIAGLAVSVCLAGAVGTHEFESERHRGLGGSAAVGSISPTWGLLAPRPETTITREVYGYLPHWCTQSYLHFDLLTALGCFDVTLNPDGSITNANGFPQVFTGTIDRAHRNGVRVEVVATCFGSSSIHGAITSGATAAIANLVALAESAAVDGINMDFEGILGSDRDTMTAFMRRLSAACRSRGLSLTMATMPLDFANAYDFAALADTTDGLFIMGYNYHWQGGPEAGPVAPLAGWTYYGNLQMTIDEYLSSTGDARKLLLGLPYYGFEWPTHAETTHSPTAGYGEALSYAQARPRAQQRGLGWDSEGKVPWYRYNNGGWNQGWYDDDTSLVLKYGRVNEYDFLGTGMWALGYDGSRRELWAALRESFNRPLAELANGDFEMWQYDTVAVPSDTSANPSGWYEGRKAQYRTETGIVHGGSRSLRHVPDSLGDPWPVESRIFQDVRVVAGMWYELRGWAWKNDGRGNRVRLLVEWFDEERALLDREFSQELASDSAGWRGLSTGPLPVPSGTAFARLSLWMEGHGGCDFWDDVSFDALPGMVESGLVLVQHPTVGRRVVRARTYDVTGRLRLAAGPGVYFVKGERSRMGKVVVTR